MPHFGKQCAVPWGMSSTLDGRFHGGLRECVCAVDVLFLEQPCAALEQRRDGGVINMGNGRAIFESVVINDTKAAVRMEGAKVEAQVP